MPALLLPTRVTKTSAILIDLIDYSEIQQNGKAHSGLMSSNMLPDTLDHF